MFLAAVQHHQREAPVSFGRRHHTEGLLDAARRLNAPRSDIVELVIGTETVGVGWRACRLDNRGPKAGPLCGASRRSVWRLWCRRGHGAARTAQAGSATTPSSSDIEPTVAAWHRVRRHRPRMAQVKVKDRIFGNTFAA